MKAVRIETENSMIVISNDFRIVTMQKNFSPELDAEIEIFKKIENPVFESDVNFSLDGFFKCAEETNIDDAVLDFCKAKMRSTSGGRETIQFSKSDDGKMFFYHYDECECRNGDPELTGEDGICYEEHATRPEDEPTEDEIDNWFDAAFDEEKNRIKAEIFEWLCEKF